MPNFFLELPGVPVHCHHVMNEHLIEHEEFEAGAASENANILTEATYAKIGVADVASTKINEAIHAGLFVVVSDSPFYCRATDAIVGSVTYFKSAHTTREEAELAASQCSDEDCEDRFYVLPRKPLPVRKAAPTDDLIPF